MAQSLNREFFFVSFLFFMSPLFTFFYFLLRASYPTLLSLALSAFFHFPFILSPLGCYSDL